MLPGHPQRAVSLKPEPLLGKLKDARILLSGSRSAGTIDSEPNAPRSDRFSEQESAKLQGRTQLPILLQREHSLTITLISHTTYPNKS